MSRLLYALFPIEKAQKMVSSLGLLSTIVHAIVVCDRSFGGPHVNLGIDAFGDSTQLDPH